MNIEEARRDMFKAFMCANFKCAEINKILADRAVKGEIFSHNIITLAANFPSIEAAKNYKANNKEEEIIINLFN